MGIRDERATRQAVSIKTKLFNAFQKSGLSYYSLAAELEKMDDGFNIAYNTIRNTLNPKDPTTPNLYAVLGMARLWNLDTASLLAPPTENSDGSDEVMTVEALMKSGKYVVLDEWAYQGEFHGYLMNPNTSSKEIVPMELTISKNEASGKVKAFMTYHSKPLDTHGEVVENNPEFHGTPMLLTSTENVFILFTNDKGGFFFMCFKYIEHGTQRLYYRPGIAVTITTAERTPIVVNFVLFDKKLPAEKAEKYVPGLLKVTGNNFLVEEEEVEALKEDPDVKVFMETMGYIVESEKSKKSVYRIKDSQIMTSIDDETQWESIMKALVMLKGRSLAPDWIMYPYVKDYTRFGKNYLQDDDKE